MTSIIVLETTMVTWKLAKYHELEEEKAFSTWRVKNKNPAAETHRAASIITSIACNEMYGLRKNRAEMEALCQTLSCANAPSCPKNQHQKL